MRLAASDSPLHFAIAPDQCIGRTIVFELRFRLTLEFRDDVLRELFAQFDAPLVEGVDLPDGSLGKDTVFVKRDQRTQSRRRQAFQKQRIGWTIALENAVWHEPVW